MKTEFRLEHANKKLSAVYIKIVGTRPDYKPYVSIWNDDLAPLFIADEDLEILAVNILKAIKSKKLKP